MERLHNFSKIMNATLTEIYHRATQATVDIYPTKTIYSYISAISMNYLLFYN